MGLWYITTQVPVVFHVVTSCTTGQYHYLLDTTDSYSHYHMGLWYITTQVPVVTYIPVVFHVLTSCTTGQYHYHMDTTASCSHYHMGVWYITTQVTVVTEIPVVFYVVTSCTTGITTQYFCNLDVPQATPLQYHRNLCGISSLYSLVLLHCTT